MILCRHAATNIRRTSSQRHTCSFFHLPPTNGCVALLSSVFTATRGSALTGLGRMQCNPQSIPPPPQSSPLPPPPTHPHRKSVVCVKHAVEKATIALQATTTENILLISWHVKEQYDMLTVQQTSKATCLLSHHCQHMRSVIEHASTVV